MEKTSLKFLLCLLVSLFVFSAPINAGQNQIISKVAALELSFADANWDGKIIPEGQQCIEYGGNGASPRIQIKNIPSKANTLILEFSDATYPPCDNGGHGIVSYRISKGTTRVIIPSIKGQTFDLPEGFTLIKEHCGKDLGMQRGAYIGPCPGAGNFYYVIIKAERVSKGKLKPELLGLGRLNFGNLKESE